MVQVGDPVVIPSGPIVKPVTTIGSTFADTDPTRQRNTRIAAHSYIPGLDGLRAFAVIAVLLYHADVPWARGGFLGVDIFFVLSGYLITTLLTNEWAKRDGINLASFWGRRARRLLPALFCMLLVTLSVFAVFLHSEVASLRGDALAALTYATNWYLIYGQKSYFETIGRPSPLQHLWSLAVEEQFYLLWPLLFVAGMRILRRQGLLLATLASALTSTILATLWYNPLADPSRLYYGTDTRAVALLLGATLALLMSATSQRVASPSEATVSLALGNRAVGAALDVAGFGALSVLVVWVMRLDAFAPFLYHGGFALVALASAVVIAAIIYPRTYVLPRLFSNRLLRWIGVRSYGIYLWHWPVVTITRPHLDLPLDGAPLLALRVALTVALAALSYHFVEAPIRAGALGRAWATMRQTQGKRHTFLRIRWIASLSMLAALIVSLGVTVAKAQPAPTPSYLSVTAVHITSAPRPTATTIITAPTGTPASVATPKSTPSIVVAFAANLSAILATAGLPTAAPSPTPSAITTTSSSLLAEIRITPTPATTTAPSPAATAMNVSSPTPSPAPPTPTTMPTPAPATPEPTVPPPMATPAVAQAAPPPVHVYAIGDSVMVGAAGALQNDIGDIEIDAAVSRQASTAIDILRAKRDAGELGGAVIVHMGTNGTFTTEEFDAMMQVLANVPRVVFVNVKASRSWEAGDNDVIAAGVQRYPNTVLVDWHNVGLSHPEYFWGDGIHLQPTGAQAYADLLTAALSS